MNRIDEKKIYAAAATSAILRHGGRATVRTIRDDLAGLPTGQTLRALELARSEGLVWSRDRNVWQATDKARASYVNGQRQAAEQQAVAG